MDGTNNVYNIGITPTPNDDGEIISSIQNTVSKLEDMKSRLQFQPAFFSGSKVDFLERMEFIAKLTKPARNTSGTGFSFIKPPVCHLHVGEWINTDCIINQVSYSYEDSPWAFNDKDDTYKKVQPMWCKISMSFTMIGSFGAFKDKDVALANDTGGFFQFPK